MLTKIQVARLDEIDRLGARTVTIGDREVAIFRLSDGTVRALENRCPHKAGRLSEGMVCGAAVHCPLHDWKIDLNSGQVREPDHGQVTVYETEIDEKDGAIYISL
ncbi:MAG: nitrite reductase small subunit NirD [Paenibacillus macerans]|uniref:Nitrite reductase [NAD(P)H], small subunit n=1 Tax=Paenibacillus macerans TaxID=44252 RepID=A0A090Y649_PAEMA|nr:nitrite reductase small subunit NirD [Paenibacillus macerans]KFM94223.1 nitrite reductase [NAD(P)H], small subunit [Paenibacillus macerans]MBS5910943.1 nitrite reductase small subunit NirD [Paenibacillus macerans]MCY7561866.1 nitrite reductase small subunit NirD [Paenibacillus macerans]MDU7472409.1 nitrite reductase small subunit NirD [Paenibacillus macerans]MEC0138385.1 nitrite reductase small subunit NirD [Paenibacillus macerans]